MPVVLSPEHISVLRRLTSIPLTVMTDPVFGQPTYKRIAALARFLTTIVPNLPVCSACGQPPITSWNGFCLKIVEGKCHTPDCHSEVEVDWSRVRLEETVRALERLAALSHREAPKGLGLSRLMERIIGHNWQSRLCGRPDEILFLTCARYLVDNSEVWQEANQRLLREFSDQVEKLGLILHPVECQCLHPPFP